jgi:N-acylneuraminate cytidylyltransferase
MNEKPKTTVAFVPVRGGSKSIPGKNIRDLAGKPLVAWVLEAASGCSEIDEVVVSTDCDQIVEVVESLGLAKVRIFRRSAATATDTASTESAMLEFAAAEPFGTMILIQATSPLITSADLSGGLGKLKASGADTLLSVVRQKRFLWREEASGAAHSINYEPSSRPRRQEFEGFLVENGAFYITPKDGLLKHQNRLFGKIAVWEMPEETYVELDEPSDWAFLASFLEAREARSGFPGSSFRQPSTTNQEQRTTNQAPRTTNLEPRTKNHEQGSSGCRARARDIRCFLTDVDGVLTDAGMYYSETGDELKKFNTRDAVGLRLLREAGVKVGIITSEDTQIVARRAKKMGVDFLVQGAKNKADELDKILAETGLLPEQVAFIGDDINDLTIFAKVGLTATPADGQPAVKAKAQYICQAKGGEGAVREIAEAILETLFRGTN